MVCHYLLDAAPFVQCVFSNLCFAFAAKVVDLGLVGAASVTEVIEVDVDDEVFRDNLILVLANVLWAELHLASLYVVASLDEGRVEHDAEHNFV